jgi:type I restriction enzyme M protein
MYGAILGDIVGSRFEFDRPGWTKDFEFLNGEDNWTDDTVMTIAIAEALLDAGNDADASGIEELCIKSMQKWGRKYPGAGYGGRFRGWLTAKDPKPYGSYGNGSAMRVSAAGWLYDSLERTREVARATANVTHNHPEGIKGAECTAAVIYMARTGASKEEIADYVVKEFGYDFSETLEEMRARHRMDESCQDALPKALRSFFDGESVEDTIRNAVSLGGDTDTIAAIAGAMAEGLYGMPVLYRGEVLLRVDGDMRAVLGRFDTALKPIDIKDWHEQSHYLLEYYVYPYNFEDRIDVLIWAGDGKLCYGKYYYKGTGDGSIDGESEMTFEEFYEMIEKIRIPEWDDHYEPKDCVISDGKSWEVRYESPEGKAYVKRGSNSYPKNWRSFIKALETVVGKI